MLIEREKYMKLYDMHNMKRYVLSALLLLILCIPLLEMFFPVFNTSVLADPDTTVAVDPSISSANPGQYFTINFNVTDVTDLFAWGVKLKWPYGLLETSADNITEGPFLSQGGSTAFAPKVFTNYIDIGCSLLGVTPGVTGSGILANATFKVLDTGNATLDLYSTKLQNSTLDLILHTSQNGTFYTTTPVARYSYTPHPTVNLGHPIVNETITFNATESYDPDEPYDSSPGGIVSYRWDFDDGNVTTVLDPLITHVYNESGSYQVFLNVTDDEGESKSVDHPIIGTTVPVQLHDIAVIDVEVTPAEVSTGEDFTINITALNKGSDTENLNVTVYVNIQPTVMQPVETKLFDYYTPGPPPFHIPQHHTSLESGENATTTVTWDTTGVAAGSYAISVKAFLVKMIEGKWQSTPDLEIDVDMPDNEFFYGDVNITTAAGHDLAITELKVSPARLEINEWASIKAKIKNEGTAAEQFNATITIEYESELTTLKPSGWQNQTIYAGTTTTLEHVWLKGTNTTKEGEYNITVNVILVNATTLDFLHPYDPMVPDDDPTDNTLKITETILMLPVAHFTFAPSTPLLDHVITFNASASYAPGESPGTIVQYTWNFGDGPSVTETDPATSHVFRLNRIYTVTLTITDDENCKGNTSKSIEVHPFQNIAITNVTFSPHIAQSGDSVTINVTLNTRFYEESFNVTTYFNENIIDTQSDITQPVWSYTTLTFTWDTTGVLGGDYTIKAVADTTSENTTYVGGIVTVEKGSSTITLVASPASFTVGATTTLNGSVSPAQSGLSVTIWYRLTSEEAWSTLADVTTDANGIYSHTWTPETAGTYAVKSGWQGDDSTMSSESQVRLVSAEEVSAQGIFLYTTIGLAIALVATLLYFLMIRKPPQPKRKPSPKK
jgi:PKD repeat protein